MTTVSLSASATAATVGSSGALDALQLAGHNRFADCWVAIEDDVFDISNSTSALEAFGYPSVNIAANKVCGELVTSVWFLRHGPADAAFVLGIQPISAFDTNSLMNRITQSEIRFGSRDCLASFGVWVYDLSKFRVERVLPQFPDNTDLCRKYLSRAEFLALQAKFGFTLEELAPYKVATFVEPFRIRLSDVERHNRAGDCWSLINLNVYDLTEWLPGTRGQDQLVRSLCGRNANSSWNEWLKSAGYPDIRRFQLGHLRGPATNWRSKWPVYDADMVMKHSKVNNCWTTAFGNVYKLNSVSARAIHSVDYRYVCGQPNSKFLAGWFSGDLKKRLAPFQIGITPLNWGLEPPLVAEIVWPASDIARHRRLNFCWVSINGGVYSLSGLLHANPGAHGLLVPRCGKSVTAYFRQLEVSYPALAAEIRKTRIGRVATNG